MQKFDIFICYRSDGGFGHARLLFDRLTSDGYNVFLDVERLESGHFDTKLYLFIESCTDFIVVLSKGSLDRCANDGDWVRREISHAIAHDKNIVPVFADGFTFPISLPSELSSIARCNGVELSREHFDSTIKKLHNKLLKSRPIRRYIRLFTALAIVLFSLLFAYLNNDDVKSLFSVQKMNVPSTPHDYVAPPSPPTHTGQQNVIVATNKESSPGEPSEIQVVGSMKIGDKGWGDPGVLYVDRNNTLFIRRHSAIYKGKSDSLKIFIEKKQKGFFVDISRCYCKFERQSSPTAGDIPVDDLKLFRSPSEVEIGDSLWVNLSSIYADTGNSAFLEKDSKLHPMSSSEQDVPIVKSQDGFSINLKGVKGKIKRIEKVRHGDIPISNIVY